MQEYDLIVLGGGTGNLVAAAGADADLDVALVERDRLGGTCLNRGCNPSKQLIHRADVVETVRRAGSLGVEASVDDIAFGDIVEKVTADVTAEAERKARRAREEANVTFYQTEGRFVDERVVEVAAGTTGAELTADDIVLAGGSRPLVPDAIDGTDDVDYLTSADALRLTECPDRLVVVGGGYIAVEMAHFFGTMGTDVAIVGRGDVLADREDEDIARRLTEVYADRHELHLGFSATEVTEAGDTATVTAESEADEEITVAGDEVLIATGRRPNTDLWNVGAAGIGTDEKGHVETDESLETSVEGVWAIGDIAGNYMFKHSGDKEAEYVAEAVVEGNDRAVEYPGMAHAIFGSPQVASLGDTESDIDDREYDVGTFEYDDTALGKVLATDAGFAKAIVAADGDILGCHVVGPHASVLIHEVSTAVAAGADAETLAGTIHVHPALSEIVQGAFLDALDETPGGL